MECHIFRFETCKRSAFISAFSICMTVLCKHINKVRSSQASISINSCPMNWTKHSFSLWASLKLITWLRRGLNHLRFHKFMHSFQDPLNPTWNCGTVKTTIHYLLHCPSFSNERLILFKKLQSIGGSPL